MPEIFSNLTEIVTDITKLHFQKAEQDFHLLLQIICHFNSHFRNILWMFQGLFIMIYLTMGHTQVTSTQKLRHFCKQLWHKNDSLCIIKHCIFNSRCITDFHIHVDSMLLVVFTTSFAAYLCSKSSFVNFSYSICCLLFVIRTFGLSVKHCDH